MRRPFLLTAAGLALLMGVAFAADHFDGADTAESPESDIADFYAFPKGPAGAPDRLVLILNTSPRAGKTALFSDAVEYGFRIRSGSVEKTELGVGTRVGDREVRIACRFDATKPDADDLGMRADCVMVDKGVLIAASNVAVDQADGGPDPAMRVFAGLRADPFFTDAIRVRLARPRHHSLSRFVTTGNSMRPAYTAVGVNLGGPKSTRRQVPNVLSIVMEIDIATLLPELGPNLAIVAETNRRTGGAR